jgi:hypothetical protein
LPTGNERKNTPQKGHSKPLKHYFSIAISKFL